MKASNRLFKELNNLLIESYFTPRQILSIKNYPESHRIYVLMLFPHIPLSVRCKAVHLYKRFINPSCKIPFYIVNKLILCSQDLTKEDYINTLHDIYSTDLIIY